MSVNASSAAGEETRTLRSSKKLSRCTMLKGFADQGKYRPMHRFTPVQREKLLRLFAINRYPSTDVKRSLAEEFHVSIHRISCWFNEKRRARNNYLGLHGSEKARSGSSRFSVTTSPESFGGLANPKKMGNNKQLLTKRQLEVLSSTFERKKYISATEQAALCEELNLTENQITNWFVHRRHRLRKTALGIGIRLGERDLFELFSPIQLTEFLHFYNKPEMPSVFECSKLATELQVSTKRVVSWFQKRDKMKRDNYDTQLKLLDVSSRCSSETEEAEFSGAFRSGGDSECCDEQMGFDDDCSPVESAALDSSDQMAMNAYSHHDFDDDLSDAMSEKAVESADLDELNLPVDLDLNLSSALLAVLANSFKVTQDWMENWCIRSIAYCREKRYLFPSSTM